MFDRDHDSAKVYFRMGLKARKNRCIKGLEIQSDQATHDRFSLGGTNDSTSS